jgi:adenine-specific DNA-methyltransferase
MAKKKPATKAAAPVDSIRHRDKRKNIPTEELRDFVAEAEEEPKVVLYPRDPSLDPQLVWKGKDEQDQRDLAVPAVPIYIQEKIHPQAIIDDFRRYLPSPSGGRGAGGEGEEQLQLFSDFNGLPEEFDKRVDFYHHDANWSNRLILGDSLLVMNSLAEKENLRGQVQMIYIDPPYGIDFKSNWQVSTRKRDVKDGRAEDTTRQPEQVKAFRDTWELGIHSYLAYLRDRLVAARELLTESGSVFVQIGDENVHLVRCVMDEVFGSENFVSLVTVRKTTSEGSTLIGSTCDYLVWFGKSRQFTKFRPIYLPRSEEAESRYDQKLEDGTLYQLDNITSSRPSGEGDVTAFTWKGQVFTPGKGTFKTTESGLRRLANAERLQVTGKGKLRYRRFQNDFGLSQVANLWSDISGAVQSRTDPKVYVVQTSFPVIERCLLMTTDPGDLVLDPTCGSGTTAYVAEQWGRRWITIDTSRVALTLARTRLMAARFPYYYLADDYPQITQMAADEEIKAFLRKTTSSSGSLPSAGRAGEGGDIRKGFVYRRVPHVTLKSIANNPDVREGMTRSEIDAAIARHAETETLYDQPYEDNKRVRVAGPFTVESLSPHRTISVEEKRDRAEVGHAKTGLKMQVVGPDKFGLMILENLRKAGVQNTKRGERLKFDSVEPYAGEWIHGEGRFTESPEKKKGNGGSPHSGPLPEGEGVQRRAAICVGPEFGTVGASLIKEAAKEAVRGIGFDVLIVCGFAFDSSVAEETKEYGKLVVLPTRMNPDLAMGDELLKKTGAGNLFMVFGEPDIEIRRVTAKRNGEKRKNGRKNVAESTESTEKIVVEIRGLDVYDPTTGEIRSSSTDDIACWFIDTNYNSESFFVRHAYFTGADEPYDRLKRALRAEIDESAWSQLYSTASRPFDPPATGKIAVKVINHYGDEVLKVYTV